MGQFPEEVGWMRVGVASGCGAYAWVDTDEYANKIRGEGVGEVVGQVGVF